MRSEPLTKLALGAFTQARTILGLLEKGGHLAMLATVAGNCKSYLAIRASEEIIKIDVQAFREYMKILQIHAGEC
jgi:hypothetical protein